MPEETVFNLELVPETEAIVPTTNIDYRSVKDQYFTQIPFLSYDSDTEIYPLFVSSYLIPSIQSLREYKIKKDENSSEMIPVPGLYIIDSEHNTNSTARLFYFTMLKDVFSLHIDGLKHLVPDTETFTKNILDEFNKHAQLAKADSKDTNTDEISESEEQEDIEDQEKLNLKQIKEKALLVEHYNPLIYNIDAYLKLFLEAGLVSITVLLFNSAKYKDKKNKFKFDATNLKHLNPDSKVLGFIYNSLYGSELSIETSTYKSPYGASVFLAPILEDITKTELFTVKDFISKLEITDTHVAYDPIELGFKKEGAIFILLTCNPDTFTVNAKEIQAQINQENQSLDPLSDHEPEQEVILDETVAF